MWPSTWWILGYPGGSPLDVSFQSCREAYRSFQEHDEGAPGVARKQKATSGENVEPIGMFETGLFNVPFTWNMAII